MGAISRRFGNKPVIILCNLGVLISLCMALLLIIFPFLGYAWLFSTCLLASLSMSCWFGYFIYLIDIAPKEHRPVYMVIDACISIPFSFIGYATGALIDRWGFAPPFVISAVFAVTAMVLSTFLLSKRKIAALQEPMEIAASHDELSNTDATQEPMETNASPEASNNVATQEEI